MGTYTCRLGPVKDLMGTRILLLGPMDDLRLAGPLPPPVVMGPLEAGGPPPRWSGWRQWGGPHLGPAGRSGRWRRAGGSGHGDGTTSWQSDELPIDPKSVHIERDFDVAISTIPHAVFVKMNRNDAELWGSPGRALAGAAGRPPAAQAKIFNKL